MAASEALVALVGTLQEVSTTLQEMRSTLRAQREAVATNDLAQVLDVTGQQEELGARLARLERHRERTQRVVEVEIGANSIRELCASLPEKDPFAQRMTSLTSTIADQVRALQVETHQNSSMLLAAIELARRSRGHLLKLSGTEPAYVAGAANREGAQPLLVPAVSS